MAIATHPLRSKQLFLCLSAAFAAIPGIGNSATLPSASVFGWRAPAPFVAHPGRAHAPTSGAFRNVINCLDDGSAGSLRQVIAVSGSGDVVDLSGLPVSCSTITLTQGQLSIGQSSLALLGPSSRTLTIKTNQIGRILNHTGSGGTLAVYNLTLRDAKVYTNGTPAKGGCIFSAANVNLTNTVISGCAAAAYTGLAMGGGVYAAGGVYTSASKITGNGAYTYDSGVALGGGVYAGNGLDAAFSTISANFCGTAAGGAANGGGAYVTGSYRQTGQGVILAYSTIDHNQASIGGGIMLRETTGPFFAQNSTISGNVATTGVGGVYVSALGGNSFVASFYSTTVAFNSAPTGGGVVAHTNLAAFSSVFANNRNTSGQPFADLYIQGAGHALSGQKTLIVSSNEGVPGNLTADPKLTPLASRGGSTRTHGLSLSSPAVGTGGAFGPVSGFGFDQRGSTFTREVPAGSPDIGAYERQANDDELFYGGFD